MASFLGIIRKNLESILHVVVIVVLVLLPVFFSGPYGIFVGSAMIFYAMVVMGLNIISSAGVWNLAHATFFAIGGYTAGFLAIHLNVSLWFGILIGSALAAILSVIVMIPILKLHQHYLMIATFNLCLIGNIVLINWERVTSGTSGLSGIPPINIPWLVNQDGIWRFGMFPAVRPIQIYYIILVGALIVYLISRRLERSTLGLLMRAMRDDDQAAQAMGQDTRKLRLLAMGIGSAIAGFAGGIYAVRFHAVSPQASSLDTSILFMVMLTVGGSGNIYGALVGGALISMLPELLRGFESYRLLAYGIILLLVMLFRPQGLIPERVRKYEVPEEVSQSSNVNQSLDLQDSDPMEAK